MNASYPAQLMYRSQRWLAACGMVCVLLGPIIARADLSAELNAPGDAPQLRGLGIGGHFGRMPNWDIDKLLPRVKEMGVDWVRDEWGWQGVEKEKGVYQMNADMEHRIDVLHASGIKILCALDYGNNIYDNPLDPDAFAKYAAFMAKTYKGKVTVWEIWNEPDNFYFFKQYGGNRDGSNEALWMVKHSELIRKAAAAIKAVDPEAIVIHNMEGASWNNALLTHADDYKQTDGVDLHPYPKHIMTEGVEGTDEKHNMWVTLDENSIDWPKRSLGHAQDCWVGESGFSTYEPKDPKQIHFQPVTEPIQAAGQVRTVLIGLAHGVKAWCIYDFVNESADPHDVESNFGLIRDVTHNWEPKPAFYSLKRLARLLGPDWKSLDPAPAKLEANLSTPPSASPWLKEHLAQAYWFKGVDGHTVTVLWKAGAPDINATPELGTIAWPNAPDTLSAEAVNLVTGDAVPVKLEKINDVLTLTHIPITWAPVAIRWSN